MRVSRRQALKQMGAAGAGLALAPAIIRGQGDGITIGGRPVEIAVSSISPATVRLTLRPLAGGQPSPVPGDGALARPAAGQLAARARDAGSLGRVRAGHLTVAYAPDPPALTVETQAGRAVQRLTFDAGRSTLSFALPNGPLLGLGEGGPQFDRKGSRYRMVSGQGGYELRTHGGRVPIQWLVGTDGWGLYVHQPLGQFDLSGATGVFTPASDAPLDLFVVASDDPAVIIGEYARLTGLAEMPALWTLGYLQSHRTLGGADEVLGIARTFREKKLPCDALIYLGTDFCPSGWNTHNGEFTWNPANFPNPKAMLDQLHAEHFKVVLHVVVEGRHLTGTVRDVCTTPAQPPGRTPDGRWPADRQVACYWPAHKPLFDAGVDGWWPDQGDGYDAASRLARIRMYWDGSRLYRPDERPFALHRNGYAGMQRYGAFLWSGDVYSTWDTLATHVANAVNTGLSGIPFWGTDIGGFVPTAEYTGELHVRWFQFGAFCPLFRAHGRDWHLRLPWGWNTGELGPNEVSGYTGGAANPDPSELHNAQVEPICRKYLELRYRLLPYLYAAVRECARTGLPIMRALWLHYPDDPAATSRGDQYLWGRDLLVAPVVEKGAASRRVYLPRGTWYDFWTEAATEGAREVTRTVDLATIPLYVRAGAIVPMAPVRQYVDEPVDGPLTLTVYPGSDGSCSLYEDDGRTFAYTRGDWMELAIAWHDVERRLTIRLAAGSRMRPPARRPITVRLAGATTTRDLVFAGAPVDVRFPAQETHAQAAGPVRQRVDWKRGYRL
jgi:alpha-glucosidase (family GH31 glycosyl hydrolase)